MGWAISVKRAMAEGRSVLLDTNVLIGAMKEEPTGGLRRQSVVAIDRDKRFVTELVLWEFLCDAQIPRADRAARRAWLARLNVRPASEPSGYRETLFSLLKVGAAQGGGVDAQLAAYSVSSRGSFAIATNNVKDFCWHDAIPLVLEFASTSKTPFDCK